MAELERVATVENEPEAELVVGLLRTEGISAMWQLAGLGAAGAGIGSAGGISGPFDVLVQGQDAERARELLAAEAGPERE